MTMADDGERVAPNVQYTPDAVRAFIDENEDDPNEAARAKGELADAMGTDFDMSGFVDPDAWDMDGKPREAAPEPEPVKDEAPKEEPADAKTETTETPEKEQPEAKAEPDADHSPPPDTGQNDEIAAKLAAQERENRGPEGDHQRADGRRSRPTRAGSQRRPRQTRLPVPTSRPPISVPRRARKRASPSSNSKRITAPSS